MVYLIHFNEPYITESGRKVQHYIGFTSLTLEQRLSRHKGNDGAKLLRAVNARGITYNVVRTWKDGTLQTERELKRSRNHKQHCPLCNPKLNQNNNK